jgi:hypothetical protein
LRPWVDDQACVKSCVAQIADKDPPTTAQRALTVVSLVALNGVTKLNWPTMAKRDSAVEALCLHIKESVQALDHYDLDNAGHG